MLHVLAIALSPCPFPAFRRDDVCNLARDRDPWKPKQEPFFIGTLCCTSILTSLHDSTRDSSLLRDIVSRYERWLLPNLNLVYREVSFRHIVINYAHTKLLLHAPEHAKYRYREKAQYTWCCKSARPVFLSAAWATLIRWHRHCCLVS